MKIDEDKLFWYGLGMSVWGFFVGVVITLTAKGWL